MNHFLEVFSSEFIFRNALIASILMGLFCPLVGRNLVFGRTIMLGLALPEISLAGIAFLFMGAGLGWSGFQYFQSEFSRALAGSMIFTLPALVILAYQFSRQKTLTEGWLAFLFLLAVSMTELMISSHAVGETYLEDLSHGRMILIGNGSLCLLVATLGLAAAVSLALRHRIILVLSDWEFSKTLRINLWFWHLILAMVHGVVIGVCVSMAGPAVTFGFLILPVMTGGLVARSLRSHMIISMIAGVTMGFIGFWLSYRWDLPLGATIVGMGCGLFILVRVLGGRLLQIT